MTGNGKLCESAETYLEEFVKSHEANLTLDFRRNA